jgi:energy-coupling factor transport system ATP-binding protein
MSHLDRFGLAEKQDHYPRDLSVGERQRTALAAITVHQPTIILLDEPTRGMDYKNKAALSRLMLDWRNEGRSICLITHDVEFAALIADRVILLEEGRIRFNGNPKEAYTKFSRYQTQTAKIFPGKHWIRPSDISLKY